MLVWASGLRGAAMRRGAEVELALVTAAAAPDASAFSAAELASVGLHVDRAGVGGAWGSHSV
ncbi:MAG: hypothetical protein U1U88_001068 [Lawsonella clevelandensis]